MATSRLRHAESHTLGLFVKMCNAIEGPLVTDAYVAALAIGHGCELSVGRRVAWCFTSAAISDGTNLA